MLKKLLVVIDGSDACYRAVDLAATLAAKLDASLCLLHVISDAPLPKELRQMIEYEQINESRLDILKNSGSVMLDNAAERAGKQGARKIEQAMRQGDPADAIVQFAEDNDIDLIVMGRRGLGQLKALLLGSVSRKVCNTTTISCLTVK